MRFQSVLVACAAAILTAIAPALATTKGLNQIVTPDIQPLGQLSVSYQQVDPNIANRMQVQLELGVTKQLEVALFQGFSGPTQIFNAEYGLVQSKHYLLSTGFANWSSHGDQPQPYLEAGYQNKAFYGMIGVIRVNVETQDTSGSIRRNYQTQAILGAAYHIDPRTTLQLDYQSGQSNFATAGFIYNITPQLQCNPAVYLTNATPYKGYGYVVLTWNIMAFK